MGLIDSLINFTLSLLPDGPLWRDAAGQRLGRALARAFETSTAFAANMRDAIFPGTAGREVLVQWWEWLRGNEMCIATPSDTEDLRFAVLSLLGARQVDLFVGLENAIAAFLPFVDLAHLLVHSVVPCPVPVPVEATGRVLRCWYPEAIYPLELVRCIVERFQPAGECVQYVTPTATFQTVGFQAQQNALLWARADGCRLVVQRALLPSEPPIETVTYTLSSNEGGQLLSIIFGVSGSTLYLSNEFFWWFERDFGDGNGFVRVSNIAEYWLVTPVTLAFELLTGLQASILLLGTKQDVIGGPDFVAVGSAVENVAALGLRPNPITARMMTFDRGDGTAWAAPDNDIGDYVTGTPACWIVVFRSADPDNSLSAIIGNRDDGVGNAGFEVTYNSGATALLGRVTSPPTTATSTFAGDTNDGQWHIAVLFIEPVVELYTELGSGTQAALPGSAVSPDVFTIGTGRLGTSGMEVALMAYVEGSQVTDLTTFDRENLLQDLAGVFIDCVLVLTEQYQVLVTSEGEVICQ